MKKVLLSVRCFFISTLLLSWAAISSEKIIDEVNFKEQFECTVEKALTNELFRPGDKISVELSHTSGLYRYGLDLMPGLLVHINVTQTTGKKETVYLVDGTVSSGDNYQAFGKEYTFAETQKFGFPAMNIRNLVVMDNKTIDVRYRGYKGDKQFYIEYIQRYKEPKPKWRGKILVSNMSALKNDYAIIECDLDLDALVKFNSLNTGFMKKYEGQFIKATTS
jgi:hypothetical protein